MLVAEGSNSPKKTLIKNPTCYEQLKASVASIQVLPEVLTTGVCNVTDTLNIQSKA